MMEEKNKKPIDFVEIAKKLWPHRKKYCYVLPITLFATYLLMVCIPRYYKCTVSLAPEIGGASIGGSLGSLASSFGFGNLPKMGSEDAIFAEIYPNVIASKDFIADLVTVEVTTKDGDVKCNYYTYMRDKQSAAWWNVVRSKITEFFKPTPHDAYQGTEKLSVFNLTKRQSNLFDMVSGNIKCYVDKKTNVVAITVTDQDPLVCATIADATCKKLQEFIVRYRTNKANIDYEYYKKLCDESKAEYDKAFDRYAAASDKYSNSVLMAYKSKIDKLENDVQAKHNIYTAINTQMQAARAKLQEATPAFTIIDSASVPVKPAGPKRMIISIVMMVLSFFILSGWLLVKEK